jgi:hypothetical protein
MANKREDHNYTIRGKKFLWRYTYLRGKAVGWAYHDGKVLIDDRLTGQKRLDTEIHEFLHCAYPDLSEEAVDITASDLARILYGLGYRRNE